MHRTARCLLLLVVLMGLSGTALADIMPHVEIRLVSPFVAVNAGETYEGRLEIMCTEAGTLSQFELASDGWAASLDRAPGTKSVQAGERFTVDFTARAVDPQQRLEFTCDFKGFTIQHALDLSERNVRDMTFGAPVDKVPAFLDTPGDRSWGETDLILGIEPTVTKDELRRTINVSGRFGCATSGGWLPAHSITIEIWDQDTGDDDLMATGSTNFDGYYSIDVDSNDGDAGSDPDIYVRFILNNSRMRVYEPTSGDNYVYATGVQTNYSGSALDFGSLQPANPDLQASVFMHTQGTRSWVHDYVLGYDVPAARIEWPSAAWPNCSPSGRIQMRQDFSWNDGTVFHEYGHWFDHEMAGWEPWNYCNGICDNSPTDCGHCFWCQESETIAWLEGWAQIHGIAITDWYPGYYGWTPLNGINGESLSTCGGSYDVPLLTEGFTAALGQDIMDSAQDSHGIYGSYTDALAVGAGPVFAVCALDNPTGSGDFAAKFVARYPGYREAFWETAANCGYWFDTTPPGVVTSLTSTSHSAGVASPDPTVRFTWTRASDNYSGIQGYGLYISTGGPGLPSAVIDIGDVTSYTTDALSPGTYYFNIRAADNADYWSSSYANWGPIVIREPDPADVTSYLAGGWDYPLVPRTLTDTTTGYAPLPATLPGDAALTYWNIFGQNQGEAATGAGFYAWLNIDGVFTQSAFWNEIGAGGLYYGPNRGPVYVQAGRHSFTTRHDATDTVAEENELNNNFGRQFIWTAASVGANTLALRPSPPEDTGGWSQVTSGVTYYNCDGLNMPTGTGWWHAMSVWALDDTNDFDARMHAPSTGAEDGFGASVAYSANGAGYLDAVLVNRNQVGGTSWDVGVPAWIGSGDYYAYHATSLTMGLGDSITVAMSDNQPILLREFYINSDNYGPISVTASGDPADGPLRLVVMNSDFTQGTLTAGSQVGSAWTDGTGFARVSSDLNTTGWYGIAVYRNQADGLLARDVTIEISTTPPDLAPWTPTGWHAAITPRPALDGTPTSCPEPDTLLSAPDFTYINVAATNLGPVPSALPTRAYRDDVYMGWINWGVLGSGAQVLFNWDHAFAWSSGRHVLSYRVDALQEIEETNEGNNIRGEQWIWAPVPVSPGQNVVRGAPPINTAGWDDVTVAEPLWYNCDGLRLTGTGSGYWNAVAIQPADGSDYDLRLHTPGVGAKSGFGVSLTGSFEAGTVTEYVLVDNNTVAFGDWDVGVLHWSGGDNYRAHAGTAVYQGDHPTGTWGPFEVPSGGLVSMNEFYFFPENYEIVVENLSGGDLGVAIHQEGNAFQNRLSAVATADDGGTGQNETVTLDVAAEGYYCIVVYRVGQGGGPLQYRLRGSNSVTAVENGGVPQVTQLAGAYPNPFNPQTTVAFDLSRADHARVMIYDVQGRVVRRLVDESLPAGRHETVWQGRDDNGRSVSSGVYFARLEATSGHGMTKLVLVK